MQCPRDQAESRTTSECRQASAAAHARKRPSTESPGACSAGSFLAVRSCSPAMRSWGSHRAQRRCGMSIVAISETAGSLGNEIGRRLAERLGYRFADREIIAKASEGVGENVTDLRHGVEEKPTLWERFTDTQHRYKALRGGDHSRNGRRRQCRPGGPRLDDRPASRLARAAGSRHCSGAYPRRPRGATAGADARGGRRPRAPNRSRARGPCEVRVST